MWIFFTIEQLMHLMNMNSQGLKCQNIQRGFLLANLENNYFQGPNRTNYLGGKQQMIMLVKQTCKKINSIS